jgi:glutamine amidotransferase
MIVIVDYKIGNIKSIMNMIHKVGYPVMISSRPEEIKRASAIILPGVGAFDYAMGLLRESGLISVIKERVLIDKIPILGICLGMHMFFDSSEEGNSEGLGWIPGIVKKISYSDIHQVRKVPNMGWRSLTLKNNKIDLYETDKYYKFYFVHSYHVVCDDKEDVNATIKYGYEITCSVQRDNIYGVQFHPEKSHKYGMRFFESFTKIISK